MGKRMCMSCNRIKVRLWKSKKTEYGLQENT